MSSLESFSSSMLDALPSIFGDDATNYSPPPASDVGSSQSTHAARRTHPLWPQRGSSQSSHAFSSTSFSSGSPPLSYADAVASSELKSLGSHSTFSEAQGSSGARVPSQGAHRSPLRESTLSSSGDDAWPPASFSLPSAGDDAWPTPSSFSLPSSGDDAWPTPASFSATDAAYPSDRSTFPSQTRHSFHASDSLSDSQYHPTLSSASSQVSDPQYSALLSFSSQHTSTRRSSLGTSQQNSSASRPSVPSQQSSRQSFPPSSFPDPRFSSTSSFSAQQTARLSSSSAHLSVSDHYSAGPPFAQPASRSSEPRYSPLLSFSSQQNVWLATGRVSDSRESRMQNAPARSPLTEAATPPSTAPAAARLAHAGVSEGSAQRSSWHSQTFPVVSDSRASHSCSSLASNPTSRPTDSPLDGADADLDGEDADLLDLPVNLYDSRLEPQQLSSSSSSLAAFQSTSFQFTDAYSRTQGSGSFHAHAAPIPSSSLGGSPPSRSAFSDALYPRSSGSRHHAAHASPPSSAMDPSRSSYSVQSSGWSDLESFDSLLSLGASHPSRFSDSVLPSSSSRSLGASHPSRFSDSAVPSSSSSRPSRSNAAHLSPYAEESLSSCSEVGHSRPGGPGPASRNLSGGPLPTRGVYLSRDQEPRGLRPVDKGGYKSAGMLFVRHERGWAEALMAIEPRHEGTAVNFLGGMQDLRLDRGEARCTAAREFSKEVAGLVSEPWALEQAKQADEMWVGMGKYVLYIKPVWGTDRQILNMLPQRYSQLGKKPSGAEPKALAWVEWATIRSSRKRSFPISAFLSRCLTDKNFMACIERAIFHVEQKSEADLPLNLLPPQLDEGNNVVGMDAIL